MAEKSKIDAIIEGIESLTVIELAELVKKLEEKFGVSAQVPVMGAPIGTGTGAPAQAEEKTEFDVILVDAGEKKIPVLKEIRSITGLGLKEAKDLIGSTPGVIKKGVSKEEAQKIKQTLEALGAKVEIK
ncbi:MAG: 50S ribosomal protein L7/L12 [candidate division WOR-3 bacterium]